jgi:hypothetical protein
MTDDTLCCVGDPLTGVGYLLRSDREIELGRHAMNKPLFSKRQLIRLSISNIVFGISIAALLPVRAVLDVWYGIVARRTYFVLQRRAEELYCAPLKTSQVLRRGKNNKEEK